MSSTGSRAHMGPVAAVGTIGPVFASFGLTIVRKFTRGRYRSLMLAALLVGLCQASQAQEAPGAAPSTPFTGGAITLFQNVRIFDGVASPYNPIESTRYTEAELRAAVEAADNWGTYVTVHAYTPRAIRQAIAAGVKCIEHAT